MKTLILALSLLFAAAPAYAQELTVDEPPASSGLKMVPLPGNLIGYRFQDPATNAFIEATMRSPDSDAHRRAVNFSAEHKDLVVSKSPVSGDAMQASYTWVRQVFKKTLAGQVMVKTYEAKEKSYTILFYTSCPLNQQARFAPFFTAIIKSTGIL